MSRRKKVLVVDDERDLVDLISLNLQRQGYEVITAHDGKVGLELARKQLPDLIILDLMMPGLSGQEVVTRIKGDPQTATLPILMLTARGEETDIIVGLSLGADDYVTKPFSVKVLMARVAAVLRRKAGNESPQQQLFNAGPLAIDQSRHEITLQGKSVNVTPTEFKLLTALAAARGRVLSRDQLTDRVMGADVYVTDRAIDVHVTAVRKKLGDFAWMVHTVRGVGYRLIEAKEEDAA
ncbi:MAG TPA: response regulator transcription factor [Phycisphaerae bacterium]|nr:response regulator transcription factor [Phycisphaerae bacterium]